MRPWIFVLVGVLLVVPTRARAADPAEAALRGLVPLAAVNNVLKHHT